MARYRKWILAAAAIVLIAAIIVVTRGGNGAVVVETDRVTRRDVFRSFVTASGEVVATRYADIGSSVMGRLDRLLVAEGDRVKAGQIVARIDAVAAGSDADAAEALVRALEADEASARQAVQLARANLAQAHARAREATATLDRQRQLQRDGLTTAADFDSAQAAADGAIAQVAAAEAAVAGAQGAATSAARRVAQARAQSVRARDVLSKTEVAAPVDGIVSRLQVREGEMVVIGIQNQPGTTLMTISDMSVVNAEVKVAEADVLRVAVGQPATVTLEAMPGRTFTGRVAEVGASALPLVSASAAAREFRVKVRIDQPDPGLRPGLTCDAEILTGEKRNVLTVPLQAVVLRTPPGDRDDRTGVLVAANGRVAFAPVTTGIIGGLDIEVDGVPEGTIFVSGPYQVLRTLADGTRIRATR